MPCMTQPTLTEQQRVAQRAALYLIACDQALAEAMLAWLADVPMTWLHKD